MQQGGKPTQVVLLPLLHSLHQSPQGGVGLAPSVVTPHAVVPGEEHDGAGQHGHQQGGSHRHGPVEGDGGGTQQAQVQGGAHEGQARVAQLEEAVVPRHIACQLQQGYKAESGGGGGGALR